MRVLGWLLAVAAITAACGFGGPLANASISCGNMPSGACDEQLASLTVGLANVTDVTIDCAPAPPCTRAHGAGVAEIRLANGQKINRAWSYTGDPAPLPLPVCNGLALELCQSTASSEVDGISPSTHVAAITVTCTSATCTEANGEVKVRILLGDGSVRETTSGWSSQ
jgi:hypothetical protein